jgi:predicted dehydrogenase
MSDKTFGWLFIGSGSITVRVLNNFPQTNGQFLAAVYSKTYANAQKLAVKHNAIAYSSLDDALKDKNVKAVYVAVPHPLHKEITLEVLKHKIPLLVEKPLAMNLDDADIILKGAETANTYLKDALWTFHNPVVQKVFKIINSGEIGEIKTANISFSFNTPFDSNSRLYNVELGGGSVLDVGVYAISFAYFVFNQRKPVEVIFFCAFFFIVFTK